MKARIFSARFVACAAACVAGVTVAAACSSFSSEQPVTEAGAGSDASTTESGPDAASGSDAALPPTPGKIDCFGTTCSSATETCCVDDDAGAAQCGAKCGTGGIPIACDDSADCAPGKICCVGVFGNVDCQSRCSGERLCHADSECDVGSSCVEVPCRGTVIGVCGPVGSYVKGFCADDHDQ
jgi:hypothetical protein